MNELRRLAITIIEDIEEHINKCENSEDEPIKPFDKEPWYEIENKVYNLLKEKIVLENQIQHVTDEDYSTQSEVELSGLKEMHQEIVELIKNKKGDSE